MKFVVDNMTCMHCKMNIEKSLKSAGFKKVSIDLQNKTVEVESKTLTAKDAKDAVEAIGYHFQEL